MQNFDQDKNAGVKRRPWKEIIMDDASTPIFYKKQVIRNGRLNFSKVKKQPYSS